MTDCVVFCALGVSLSKYAFTVLAVCVWDHCHTERWSCCQSDTNGAACWIIFHHFSPFKISSVLRRSSNTTYWNAAPNHDGASIILTSSVYTDNDFNQMWIHQTSCHWFSIQLLCNLPNLSPFFLFSFLKNGFWQPFYLYTRVISDDASLNRRWINWSISPVLC